MPALGTISSTTNVENHPAAAFLDTTHSPVALYSFDGDLLDSSGNGLDLSMTAGTAYYGPAPPVGDVEAIFFQSSRAMRGTTAAFQILTDLTIEAMVFPSIIGASDQVVFGYSGSLDSEAENVLWQMRLASGNRLVYAHESGAGVDRIATFDIHIPPGQWSHLAFTRDNAGTGINAYVNGVLRGSTTLGAAPTGGTAASLYVGAYFTGVAPFTGFVSSAKIIAAELNAAQVLAEANRALPYELRP